MNEVRYNQNDAHHHTHKKVVEQNVISSFGIGFLHGLAGVAHFLLLLPVLWFENQLDGIQYIIGFAKDEAPLSPLIPGCTIRQV